MYIACSWHLNFLFLTLDSELEGTLETPSCLSSHLMQESFYRSLTLVCWPVLEQFHGDKNIVFHSLAQYISWLTLIVRKLLLIQRQNQHPAVLPSGSRSVFLSNLPPIGRPFRCVKDHGLPIWTTISGTD